MNSDYILHIAREGLEMALLVSAPVMGVALVVGFLTAMFQAVTSIKDMTMGTVVKLVAVGVTLMICGNWMMQVAVKHAAGIFQHVEMLGH